MIFIRNIFAYLFSLIILILGLILLSLQAIFGFSQSLDSIQHILCRAIIRLFGIRVQATGLDKIPKDSTLLIVSNHVNILDGLVLYGYLPLTLRAIELDTHFSWPVWGSIIRRLGNIPISHSNPRKALEALKTARDQLKEGTSILTFPEGHRTRDGKLQSFMRGPFRIAKELELTILPLNMKGAFERKSVHSFKVLPGPLEIVIGTPILPDDYTELSDRKLKEAVENEVRKLG